MNRNIHHDDNYKKRKKKDVKVFFSKSSLKFLSKNRHRYTDGGIIELVVSAVKQIRTPNVSKTVDLKYMRGKEKRRRIRWGDIRIVFSQDESGCVIVVSVEQIGRRGGVYKK